MDLLGLDIGSSSIKAAILRDGAIRGRLVRTKFPTRYDGLRAEVDARAILRALQLAIRELGDGARRVDAIALAAMSPSWVAMDRRGKPLTPIVTHQDRRSVEIAQELEKRVGKVRHLQLAGNRPFPGGISSTTFAWFVRHERSLMKRADLVGHLNTFLHRQLTGARVTDPSNASFMGLYRTLDQSGWCKELCQAVGAKPALLPDIRPGNQVGGLITREAARRFGLKAGLPMTVGMMDTSAAMLLCGAKVGQLVNVSGSTDVLALCTDRPVPHERLLTRALGVGRRWMSVSTLAAAGSALSWAKDQLFPELTLRQFHTLASSLSARAAPTIENRKSKIENPAVRFEPYLAGDRMSIEQRWGAFTGLSLATKREDMLSAMIDSLAAASAARLELLKQGATRIRREVTVSGGVQVAMNKLLYRDWPGRWTFRSEHEATLRGLAAIEIVEAP